MGVEATLCNSWDYPFSKGRSQLLADLRASAEVGDYISLPAAEDYIEAVGNERGIKLTCFDYTGYPAYPRLWDEFIHRVTVPDLLFESWDRRRMCAVLRRQFRHRLDL